MRPDDQPDDIGEKSLSAQFKYLWESCISCLDGTPKGREEFMYELEKRKNAIQRAWAQSMKDIVQEGGEGE
jgi:hypothetical protein